MHKDKKKACPADCFQKIEISLPVSTKPFTDVGEIEIKCCGKPTITSEVSSERVEHGECNFTVKQELCIEVPITFGVETETKDSSFKCKEVSSSDICKDCGHDEEHCDEDDDDEEETED